MSLLHVLVDWTWCGSVHLGKYLDRRTNVLCADGSDDGRVPATTQRQGRNGQLKLRGEIR